MKTNIYGVIMAGGGGTRFWPLSRRETPKQLLNLSGKGVMVDEALERLAQVSAYGNIFIVTNSAQAKKMREVTRGKILPAHVLDEPSARNTAACIGYAAAKILNTCGDGVMIITPSDAYIRDNAKFAEVLKIAAQAAGKTDKLITVGITPTFPATGYGYIRFKNTADAVKPVLKFVEKPNLSTAEEYLKSGDYVWNSGMFVWKASVIMEKFKMLLPDIYADIMKIAASFGTPEEEKILKEVYPNIRSVSIDYGVMEKSDDILVIPAEFGWNDVGSWDMMNVLHAEDNDGNITVGDALTIDTENTTVYSSGRLVAAVGVEDLIIVETPDAVMVCPKSKAQDVKKIVDTLKEKGREELL